VRQFEIWLDNSTKMTKIIYESRDEGVIRMSFSLLVGVIANLLIIVGIVYFISYIIKKSRGHITDKDKLLWLQDEIAKWESNGIISKEQTDNLLRFYNIFGEKKVKKVNLIKVLSTIGTILLGIGLILFVASNWKQIPDIVRTIMLLTVTFGTFYLGYYFSYQKKGYSILGRSLFFLASLFWGATIALIAQIYHIPTTDNWWIFLIWALPILPVAYFFESTSVFILSSGLLLIWNFLFSTSRNIANYYYPMIVFILLLPLSKNNKLRYISSILALVIAAFFGLFNEFDLFVLLIAAGLLAYYFIQKRSLIYLLSSSISFILWTITFFLAHEQLPNYFFIVPLGILFFLTYKEKSESSLIINIIGFLVGINLFILSCFFSKNFAAESIFFIISQLLMGVILYLVGVGHIRNKYKTFGIIYKIFGFIITLIATYILSFKGLLEEYSKSNIYAVGIKIFGIFEYKFYFFICVIFGAIALLLIVFNLLRHRFLSKQARYELLILILLLGSTFLILIKPDLTLINTVVMNTILLIFAVISILYGFETQISTIFNSGILIFVLFIVSRYFDIFWKLLDRSIFFIVGGLLMIVGAAFLEKQRKKILRKMRNE